MDRKEVVEIVKSVATYYGNRFKMDDPQGVINAWHEILKDYDHAEIIENLKDYVKANHFPPTVADILKVPAAKDRAIPTYEETLQAFSKQDAMEKAPKEVAEKHLAEARKILGIKRG